MSHLQHFKNQNDLQQQVILIKEQAFAHSK